MKNHGRFLKVVICVIKICIYTELEINISNGNRQFERLKLPHISSKCCFFILLSNVSSQTFERNSLVVFYQKRG